MKEPRCTVCKHPRCDEMDRMVAAGTPSMRNIAQNFGVTVWALRRHKAHLEETLSQAARMEEIARADDLVPRLEKAVNVAEEVMVEARGMGTAEGTVSKDLRVKAGHLALHATRRIQSGLGTLSAAVDRRKARETEEKQQDLEGVRARIREELTVLRERMTEEIERRVAEEVERRVAEELARRGAQDRSDPPVSEGPPVPKAGLH